MTEHIISAASPALGAIAAGIILGAIAANATPTPERRQPDHIPVSIFVPSSDEAIFQNEVEVRPTPNDLLAFAKSHLGKRAHQMNLPGSLWCADFVNFVLRNLGLPTSGSRMARSFLDAKGFNRVQQPVPGDIIVISRGRSNVYGHVAFYNGACNGGSGVQALGGNQGGGRVTAQCIPRSRIVGVAVPSPLLALRDIAKPVVALLDQQPIRASKRSAKNRKKAKVRRYVSRQTKQEEQPLWRSE